MIAAARAQWVKHHGTDEGWFEALESAYYAEIFARAELERIRRQSPPDYAMLTPADLQERVKSALVGR